MSTLQWEDVSSDNRMTVSRARVPGGWLVFTRWGANLAGAMFYPDPNHEWNGASGARAERKAKKR